VPGRVQGHPASRRRRPRGRPREPERRGCRRVVRRRDPWRAGCRARRPPERGWAGRPGRAARRPSAGCG